VTLAQAIGFFQAGLQVTLSRSLDVSQQQSAPQAVEVWFEPDPTGVTTAAPVPLPIVSIFGSLKVTPQTITWIPNLPPSSFDAILRHGRLLVRIHCGVLIDAKQRTILVDAHGNPRLHGTHTSRGVRELVPHPSREPAVRPPAEVGSTARQASSATTPLA
jgi:hypothetical protein